MTAHATLVYIHGVGGPKHEEAWIPLVKRNLVKLGSTVDPAHMTPVAVNYNDIVRRQGTRDTRGCKPAAGPPASSTSSERFQRHGRELSLRLKEFSRVEKPFGGKIPDELVSRAGKATRAVLFKQAERYRSRRRQVRETVLAQLDEQVASDELVVIAHSLGSVVMADLLPYLGSQRHVRLLVTVGSPLGIDDFWMLTTGQLKRAFPYDAVSAWVNIWSTSDLVCGYRGIGQRIPGVVDVPIGFHGRSPRLPSDPRLLKKYVTRQAGKYHQLGAYAAQPAMAAALDWAMRPQR